MTIGLTGSAGRLHVDVLGMGGMPVVFLHSFAGDASHWVAQLEHMRRTRRAIAIDLRGHGQSDPPSSGSYAVEALASDVAAAVDGLRLDRFVLVGHSMGGAAAIAYAGAHAAQVAGLVLVGTPGQSSRDQAQQIMSAMEKDYETVAGGYWTKLLADAKPSVEKRIRRQIDSVPRDASLHIMRALFDFDPLPALRRYGGPKLIIDTEHGDTPGSLHRLAPEIQHRVITGTSHWPQLDRPDEFNRILDEFLATVR